MGWSERSTRWGRHRNRKTTKGRESTGAGMKRDMEKWQAGMGGGGGEGKDREDWMKRKTRWRAACREKKRNGRCPSKPRFYCF